LVLIYNTCFFLSWRKKGYMFLQNGSYNKDRKINNRQVTNSSLIISLTCELQSLPSSDRKSERVTKLGNIVHSQTNPTIYPIYPT
jgi:hypothetical protein